MSKSERPYWPFRFLRWLCPPELLEEIEGDLLQRYKRDLKQRAGGSKYASRRLFWNTLRFFRPGILLRNKIQMPDSMIANNIRLAVRMLSKSKVYTIACIFGLGLTVAAFLLLLEHVRFERSFDRSFSNHNSIYRLQHSRYVENQLLYQKAMSFPEVGLALQESFPEVMRVTRLFPLGQNIEPVFSSRVDDRNSRSFSELNAYQADSSFTRIFDLHFIHGDSTTALTGRNKVTLSESTALKYFSRTDVVGETLNDNLKMGGLEITGVFKDLPPHTHFQFDLLISWQDIYGERSRFTWDGFYTYVQLHEGASLENLERGLPAFADTYMEAHYNGQSGNYSRFELRALTDIHFLSHLDGEIKPNGNATLTYSLLAMAGMIVLIALINFINLNTARSLDRLKEVGIRKIIGSTRTQLAIQFLFESFLLNVVAVVLALLTVYFLYPGFNQFFNSHITLQLWRQPEYWLGVFGFVALASLIAGFYPAFLLARQKAFEALKGLSVRAKRTTSQSVLVAFQFALSMILISGTFVFLQQWKYMQSKDLGFARDQRLVIKILPGYGDESDTAFVHRMQGFRNSLKSYPFVSGSTVSSSIPGRKNEWRGRVRLVGQDNDPIVGNLSRIDEEFISTFDLRLVAGRNYAGDANNLGSIVINEEAARQLGFQTPEQALGKKITLFREREIIGVVASFHEAGLQEPLSAAMFITTEGYTKFLTVSLSGKQAYEQIEAVKQGWKRFFPDKPFDYFFLDEYFNRQYAADKLVGRTVAWFSGLAILISCLGLVSLSAYTIHGKVKEIGIRKILGASVSGIIVSLSGKFLVPVIVAAIVGLPVSYYLAAQWLDQYAYHVGLSWWFFAVPILGLVFIGLTSTVLQSLRAANKNPVDSLKYE